MLNDNPSSSMHPEHCGRVGYQSSVGGMAQ